MKTVLAWAKANPVTIGSIAVALFAVIALFIISAQGHGLTDRMNEQDRAVRTLGAFRKSPVRIPPELPDDPERGLSICVNQAAIDQLNEVFGRMEDEFAGIFNLAVQINQHGHLPMDDGLFPEPTDAYKPFDARGRYRRIFEEMLGDYSPNAIHPRLNAGVAPQLESLRDALARAESEYISNNFFPAETKLELSPQEQDELHEAMSRKLTELLQKSAESVHVYVNSLQINEPGFPFHVDAWSQRSEQPGMDELWDGQVGLWMQQDIVEAVARANRVDDPSSNVMTAPVKRLIRVEVLPGYIGIKPGGVAPRNAGTDDKKQDRLLYDFTASATGRQSNSMYDVRHMRVTLIADAQRLPIFFENIQSVNFMTVLEMQIQAVDEYAALREGYVYGSGDSVQVDLLIESIWLRDWTKGLMPRKVYELLGISADDPDDTNDPEQPAPETES